MGTTSNSDKRQLILEEIIRKRSVSAALRPG